MYFFNTVSIIGINSGFPFVICKKTRKLHQVGYGQLKYGDKKLIPGQIIGSFYGFTGGYFFRRLIDGKIIQIQPFIENPNLINHHNSWMLQ